MTSLLNGEGAFPVTVAILLTFIAVFLLVSTLLMAVVTREGHAGRHTAQTVAPYGLGKRQPLQSPKNCPARSARKHRRSTVVCRKFQMICNLETESRSCRHEDQGDILCVPSLSRYPSGILLGISRRLQVHGAQNYLLACSGCCSTRSVYHSAFCQLQETTASCRNFTEQMPDSPDDDHSFLAVRDIPMTSAVELVGTEMTASPPESCSRRPTISKSLA